MVGFNKSGNFHDIKSRDDEVRLLKDISPCNTCGRSVDDNDIGLRCSGCKQYFHNKCTASPLNTTTFKQIVNTPDWVKVYCPKCLVSTEKAEESLKEIKSDLQEIKTTIEEKENNEVNHDESPYLAAVMKKMEKKVNDTNKQVRNQFRRRDEGNTEGIKGNLTRIILKPKSVDIRNSKDLRKKFNEYFPQILLNHARICVGGSYALEFENEAAAILVTEQWNKDHFAGNAGIVKLTDKNRTGIVKFVYDDLEVEDIKTDIKDKYPDVEYELFMKGGEFTGMIKVTFKDEAQLRSVITNKFNLCHRRYITEPFKHKPRVITCNICQRFGHVSRLCRSRDKPICGKCSKEGHETKDCSAAESEYKCYHCGQNDHITGSYSCKIVKEKLQELLDRQDVE